MEHKANNKVTCSVISVISMAAIICTLLNCHPVLDTVNLSCSKFQSDK